MYVCVPCGNIYLCQRKRWTGGHNPTLIDVGWPQNPCKDEAVQSCFDVWHSCATVPTINDTCCKLEGIPHNLAEPQDGNRPAQTERGRNNMLSFKNNPPKRSASTSLTPKPIRKSSRTT